MDPNGSSSVLLKEFLERMIHLPIPPAPNRDECGQGDKSGGVTGQSVNGLLYRQQPCIVRSQLPNISGTVVYH